MCEDTIKEFKVIRMKRSNQWSIVDCLIGVSSVILAINGFDSAMIFYSDQYRVLY